MEPAQMNPGEIPDGFTAVDPNNPSAGPGAADPKQAAIQQQKQSILEQACTREALARLGRIKLVKPAKAEQVENSIVSMAMQGKLPGPINEGKLIEILERGSMKAALQANGTDTIKIERKKYADDSDDSDDDDI
jgi:programmed cell death protein 5